MNPCRDQRFFFDFSAELRRLECFEEPEPAEDGVRDRDRVAPLPLPDRDLK